MAATCTVLILGGYGTFGGRLARLLGAVEGVRLIIAGRSLEKATRFCAALPAGFGHKPARVDRDADLRAEIAALAPDILVDASGPFQAYGEATYRVVERSTLASTIWISPMDPRSSLASGSSTRWRASAACSCCRVPAAFRSSRLRWYAT